MCQDPQSDLFGVSNWPLTGLSDLILGSQKVTLKVLVYAMMKQMISRPPVGAQVRALQRQCHGAAVPLQWRGAPMAWRLNGRNSATTETLLEDLQGDRGPGDVS